MERFLKNIPQNFNIPNSSTEKDLPISLEKVLPLDTSREFIEWLVPLFADGEEQGVLLFLQMKLMLH